MPRGECHAPLHGGPIVSRETPRNLAASVRQRLFNRAQERHEDFGLVLTKYGLERFLYRLALTRREWEGTRHAKLSIGGELTAPDLCLLHSR